MGSKRRNMFYQNKKQETTEIEHVSAFERHLQLEQLRLKKAFKHRNTFYENRKQETTEIVVLKGSPQGVGPAPKFTGFILTVEPLVEAAAGGGGGGGGSGGVGAGSLSLLGAAASRYHNEACPNMITHANHAPKSEVEAYWEAPQHSPGPIPHCVVFRPPANRSHSNICFPPIQRRENVDDTVAYFNVCSPGRATISKSLYIHIRVEEGKK
ncbi:hypothetical protein AAG570_005630 [Ranatra chinensis]|uniref:Reelin domain-containing protein n=1 Tax=Ranatra chinensis TaxID=642074 RepID=A0ABD0YLK8_9HEMI